MRWSVLLVILALASACGPARKERVAPSIVGTWASGTSALDRQTARFFANSTCVFMGVEANLISPYRQKESALFLKVSGSPPSGPGFTPGSGKATEIAVKTEVQSPNKIRLVDESGQLTGRRGTTMNLVRTTVAEHEAFVLEITRSRQ